MPASQIASQLGERKPQTETGLLSKVQPVSRKREVQNAEYLHQPQRKTLWRPGGLIATLFAEQWLHLQGMCTCLILSILRWGLASHSRAERGLNTHKIISPSCRTPQKQQGKAGQVEAPGSSPW